MDRAQIIHDITMLVLDKASDLKNPEEIRTLIHDTVERYVNISSIVSKDLSDIS